jgi:ubiquinone/menaquinone biosynthesis C-methylase UbiE
MKKLRTLFLLGILLLACSSERTTIAPFAAQNAGQSAGKPVYETRANHDPDGIGKFYMGREIAHVMGYQGAEWLERPERVEEERPDQVVEQMNLKPSDVVADIGAGTGYFSFRISSVVSQGKVFAVDIQPEMLDVIEKRSKESNADNVIAVKSEETDAKLPNNSVDVTLLVDVYHELSFPREMMLSVVKALKPGGRVVQIEYRGEDPNVPIKRLHKMTVAQARKEMAVVGLVWKETKNFLPQQHFIVYEKLPR